MKDIYLSIVIPAYNEELNIEAGVLGDVNEYLKKQKFSYEVLIVDDGSKDNTVNLVKERIKNMPNFKLVENNHGGKAVTVMAGLLKSKGRIAFFTDMDQATPISELEKLLLKFEQGYDIVIGSRRGRKGAPLIRKLAAWVFACLRNIILGLPFSDTQCGFKAFSRKSVNLIFPNLSNRWKSFKMQKAAVNAGFDVETLYLAKKKNLKVAEVGVRWHHVGTKRVQLISDAIEATSDMIRIKINDLKGIYT